MGERILIRTSLGRGPRCIMNLRAYGNRIDEGLLISTAWILIETATMREKTLVGKVMMGEGG
jgi:hypothetical protein